MLNSHSEPKANSERKIVRGVYTENNSRKTEKLKYSECIIERKIRKIKNTSSNPKNFSFK